MYLITLPGGTEYLILLSYLAILALCIYDIAKSPFSTWRKLILILGILFLPPVTLVYFVILLVKLILYKGQNKKLTS